MPYDLLRLLHVKGFDVELYVRDARCGRSLGIERIQKNTFSKLGSIFRFKSGTGSRTLAAVDRAGASLLIIITYD